jgi:hypothetical protein
MGIDVVETTESKVAQVRYKLFVEKGSGME